MFSDVAISVKGVSKRYEMYSQPRDRLLQFLFLGKKPFFKEFWALRNISFDINKGESVGILGRNGSGKSTLLQIIAGTLTPTEGNILTYGTLAALLELGSGFNPEFSGRENIYLNGGILGISKEKMTERFDEIVSFAEIGDYLDQPVKTYSSGMTVRLAFAVQACVSPQILIVDEALSVGDEKFQRKCFDYIESLRSQGCAILLVTHSTGTVEKFCQRGILLHKGEMHGIGTAKEIVDQYHALLYSDERAYLRYANKADTAGGRGTQSTLATECDGEKTGFQPVDEKELPLACAFIRSFEILDKEGLSSAQFQSGDIAKIVFWVDVLAPVVEIQAGILLRTVEGVSVFGSSTQYHHQNVSAALSGEAIRFEFTLKLDLCEGTYFITLAIAEAISCGDMTYLDRKTDAIVIKIYQPRILASGIAMLDTQIRSDRSTMKL